MVKHDLGFSIESWARGEVMDIFGTGEQNLGDADGSNCKRFSIKYFKDVAAGQKLFRADSFQLAPYDTKTSGEEWRYNLKVGDEVDVLDSYAAWKTATVIKKDSDTGITMSNITVGFRRYNTDGDKKDEMGKFFGLGVGHDMRLALHSIRL